MGWADNCRDGGTYIGKDGKKHSYERLIVNPPANQGSGGCSFCLLNLSLMLAAPVAGVVLTVRRWPR
jgi:hypothetical protein